jgi:alkyl sulfatase BDS1-like metallo-beta-lactamase superfamily hydrolase
VLRNGVLIQEPVIATPPDLTLTLSKADLLSLLAGQGPNGILHEGDPDALKRLFSFVDDPDPHFAIVTP